MTGGAPWEFVCVECGRSIVRFAERARGEPALCAACLTIPGWMDIPEVRKIIVGLEPTEGT